jgi:hypothetical protein
MASKCPERDVDRKKRTFKKCINCNKKGHLAKDCWFKEANKDKRPAGFKTKTQLHNSNEEAAVYVDRNMDIQEYLLGTMELEEIISDPTIWIADTAAKVHMTPHQG